MLIFLLVNTVVCLVMQFMRKIIIKHCQQQKADTSSAQLKALKIVQKLQNKVNAGPSVENYDAIMQFVRDARAIDLTAKDGDQAGGNVIRLYGSKL